MAKNKKTKTLSRVKYERKRPTFSFRIYEELGNRVQAVKKAEGISNTYIVEIAVGLLEVKVRKEKEIREQAYEEGWEKGDVWTFLDFLARLCLLCISYQQDSECHFHRTINRSLMKGLLIKTLPSSERITNVVSQNIIEGSQEHN